MQLRSPLLWLVLILVRVSLAQQPLIVPENPRVMAIGGAYVALADDPQSGFRNPAALRTHTQVGTDVSFSTAAHTGADHLLIALSNPGSEHGAAFALGFWSQGVAYKNLLRYYVPYSGTSFDLTQSTHLGLVLRTPYVSSTIDSVKSGWLSVADVSAMQSLGSLRVAGMIERAFGGGGGFIPRRLRAGAAFVSPSSGVSIVYEWRGDETAESFKFRWSGSGYGIELPMGKYTLWRVGYTSGGSRPTSAGLAIGNIKSGWRVEGAWSVPTAERAETRWSVGLAFRN